MNYYTASIGPHAVSFYGTTDEYALRVIDRWIRLFWRRYVATLRKRYRGSVAHAVADGWYGDPDVQLWAMPIDKAGVIQGSGVRIVLTDGIHLPKMPEETC